MGYLMIEITPKLYHSDADIIAAVQTGDPDMPLVVLCAWRTHGLVCWCVDANGSTHWGAYATEAWPAFHARVKRYCG